VSNRIEKEDLAVYPKAHSSVRCWIGLALLASLAVVFGAAAEEPPARVAIVPFKINAERDLSFLRDGITDMLSSRLTSDASAVIPRTEIEPVLADFPDPVTESSAREIGRRLEADHVLFGSLTVFGESVSIDAKLVAIAESTPPLAFFTQTENLGQVIPQINAFASQINREVFQREQLAAAQAQPAAPAPAPSMTAPADDIHAHPEKLFRSGSLGQAGIEGLPNPAFTGQQQQTIEATYWRSRSFDRRIDSLAIGDLDSDGRNELVVLAPQSLDLYVFESNRLVKVQEVIQDRNRNLLSADIADINGNGRPELYVTGLNALKKGLNSTVFEMDNTVLRPILEGSGWYYRVSRSMDGTPVLLGQQQRGEDTFTTPVYRMQWEGNSLVAGRQVIARKQANVLGAAVGDLMNNGSETAVAYSRTDSIRVFGATGEKAISISSDRYGGTLRDYSLGRTDPESGEIFQYLPARIIIDDVDGDGQNELLTVRNFEFGRKMLQTLRLYQEGQVVALQWGANSLQEMWNTPKHSKLVSDFVVGDLDGDGRRDLIASVIDKTGDRILSDAVSHVIAYPLSPPE
jgi:TolB-like protein